MLCRYPANLYVVKESDVVFKKFTNGCVRVVNRWLPDAFLFAIILTLIVFVAAMCATGMDPVEVIAKWGDAKGGFWNLLAFSMQMALVLVFGSAMASARPCKKALRAVAALCHNDKQAILVTTFVSTICCWLNWGFGLVIGALLAKEEVRRVPTVDYPLRVYAMDTPAEKLEHSKILWAITVVFGFVYIVYYFVQNGFTLGLNIVNMIFLFLGLLLHGDLRRYVDAIGDAAAGAAGILLQFPFCAGIMGMMVAANDQGVSLAGVISQFFVDISNNVTFPMLSFLAAGIVNFFVPSGGGQWAVQGPIMMPAGAEMNIAAGRTAMAIAWGDQWTNMIQPFWALPALGIAKLSARDIMGYLVVILLFTGAVACLGFLGWALFF